MRQNLNFLFWFAHCFSFAFVPINDTLNCLESEIVFCCVKCVKQSSLYWLLESSVRITRSEASGQYEQFTRNRSFDLVRHSTENKQTNKHTKNNEWKQQFKMNNAFMRAYKVLYLTRSITNQCWFSRSTQSLSHAFFISFSLTVQCSQVKTQTILWNCHEPISLNCTQKPLQFAHWMNRSFIWIFTFYMAEFQVGMTPFLPLFLLIYFFIAAEADKHHIQEQNP